jgi:hypothetical protein
MYIGFKALAAGALLWVAGVSQAALISVDFSSVSSNGQSYEGATLGDATFSSETGNLTYTSSYGGGIYTPPGGSGDVYIDFSTAIDFFSVTGGDGAGDSDAFGILAYEFGTNAFLGSVYSPVFDPSPLYYTLDISFSNIGRIVLDPCNGGVCPGSASSYGGVVFTDMAYNTAGTINVPAPGVLMLFGLGLAGLGFARSRKAA